jgi:hypothetical protein
MVFMPQPTIVGKENMTREVKPLWKTGTRNRKGEPAAEKNPGRERAGTSDKN